MASVRNLETACARLARAGHGSGVWDYPWSVFLSAVDEWNDYCERVK